jgi:glycosyltransferase involved in cell wall biosynthesis
MPNPGFLVSIVLPTFNRRPFLGQAVESVVNQTFKEWELLVVDDGSDDDSWKTIQKFNDPRIYYLYQRNQGVSCARNTGIQFSHFPWICFLDSDDQWETNKLQRQLEVLERHPKYQVVYTDETWIRKGRRVNPRKIHRKYQGWIYHRCLPLCIISPSSILLHRSILQQVGLFDVSFPVCEDYEMWLRISSRHPILFLEEPLIIKVGGHADQLSQSLWGLDRYRVQAMIKSYSSGDLTPQLATWTARQIAEKARILASGFTNRKKWAEAGEFQDMVQAWSKKARIAAHSPPLKRPEESSPGAK